MEESYCIVKELVMTERTYKKDLELLTNSFRQYAIKNNFDLGELSLLVELLYVQSLEPINDFHSQFLKELELRLFNWTDKTSNIQEYHKIGDLLIKLNSILLSYRTYIEKYEDILNEIDQGCKKNKKFENLYKDFESQKICYLPFTMFLLKPIQRLIHYKLLIERLLIYYGLKHYDYQETYSVFGKIENINEMINEKLPFIENKQKLIELQRDLIGVDNLLATKSFRYFIREGSLQKLSRKGYQQRMFFLFNDILFYCARSSSPILQFKVHGEYQLKNLQVEDGNPHINIANSFTIFCSNRSILVAATTPDEKSKWLQDLYEAIEKARGVLEEKINYSTIKSNSSSDNNLDLIGSIGGVDEQNTESSIEKNSDNLLSTNAYDQQQKQQQHRANTTMHVCWHRNTSVSSIDNHRSVVNQLSGYLLRKFKNSNGWQKLWVVYTNFCLFFYKTYQVYFLLIIFNYK
jgi:FERM/RhoGEF/pleckstrin domain protein 2